MNTEKPGINLPPDIATNGRFRLLTLIWALLVLLILLITAASSKAISPQGFTHHVCPAGPPTCDFASIQEAVDEASDGDLIKVAGGLYQGVHDRPAPAGYMGPATVSQLLYLTKTLTIQGGYAAGSWTAPDPVAHPTTLDAGEQGRVILIAGEIAPVIEGLRLTGGDASALGGTLWTDAGGGAYILTATATIRHCVIYDNTAGTSEWGGAGGGLFLAFSAAAVSGNTIRDNIAATLGEGYGGGLSLYASEALVSDNEIYGNIASAGDWGYGGGLDLFAADASVSDNQIYGNTASTADLGYGGGLNIELSAASIGDNIISDNTGSTGYEGYGGGVSVSESGSTLVGNTIQGNRASVSSWGYGGGLDLWQSDDTLSGNVIQDNAASAQDWGFGGGLSMSESGAVLVNNAVVGNQAGRHGSGLYIEASTPTLIHTTIARNGETGFISGTEADGSGLCATNTSNIILTNTILVSQSLGITVSANSLALLDGVLWYGNSSNSDGAGQIAVTSAITGNPALAPDGYHLRANSAALDRGLDANVVEDIDSDPRPYLVPDLGADEYWPSETSNPIYLPLVLNRHS